MSQEQNEYLNARQAPHQIKYSQLTPLAFNAKSSKRVFYTSNQSTYSQSNNVIRIPISSGTSFLDGPNSFLKFDYIVKENATHQFSNSAHSLIYRLRVISDSSGMDLENILYYGHTHCMISDLTLSPPERASRLEQGYGTNGFIPQAAANVVADTTAKVANMVNQVANCRTTKTQSPYLGCDELAMAQNIAQSVCLPLDLSCILGPAQKKFLPLFLSGGLTLEITLDPYGVNSSLNSAPIFDIANVQFHAQMIDFDASVNVALTAMVDTAGLYMHGVTWTNVLTQIAGDVRNWIVSERLKSVKSIFFSFNDPRGQTVPYFRPTNRVTNKLTSFQMKIGSEYYPNQRVMGAANLPTGNGEFIVEAYKAISEYGNVYHSSLCNIFNFAQDVSPAVIVAGIPADFGGISDEQFYRNAVGRSIYGLDVDAFGRSDTESGISTIMNNPISINFEQSGAYGSVLNVFTYLLHDAVFVIEKNGKFTVSK